MPTHSEKTVMDLWGRASLGQDPKAAEELRRLTPGLVAQGAHRLAAWSYLGQAMVSHMVDQTPQETERLLDHALSHADPNRAPLQWMKILNFRGFFLIINGRMLDAIESLVAIEHRADGVDGAEVELCVAQGNLGCTLASMGELHSAAQLMEAAIALPLEVGRTFMRIQCLSTLAWIYEDLGQPQRSLDMSQDMQRALSQCSDLGRIERSRCHDLLNCALARRSLLEERYPLALDQALQALSGLPRWGDAEEQGRASQLAARAAQEMGKLKMAQGYAEQAIASAKAYPSPHSLGQALRLSARIARQRGDHERAFQLLDRAISHQETRLHQGVGEGIRKLVSSHQEQLFQLRNIELRTSNEALRSANEDLHRIQLEVDRASRARQEFMSRMSHELRTPLHGVIGMGDLLTQTELSSEQREMVQVISHSGVLTLRLIDDILDFRALEEGKLKLSPSCFSLPELAQECVAMVTPRVPANVALTLSVDPRLPPTLCSDRARLQQVLLNLLSNALKFTQLGSVTLSLALHQELLEISVRDTGVGIAPGSLERIFKPYMQASDSTRRTHGGTGLGLAIASETVHLLGGELVVESVLTKGSCFSFCLPLTQQLDGCPQAKPSGKRSLQGMRILVAEDNFVNRRVLEMMLLSVGAQVELVEDGLSAVEAALTDAPEIVLMDLHMPKLNGDEASLRLRQVGYAGTIIALTASIMDEDRARCIDVGMDGVLTKPLTVERLTQAIYQYSRSKDDESGLGAD